MRRFCSVAFVVVLLVNFINPGISSSAMPNPATSITIWHNWDGPYLSSITQLLNQYQADHPGITISLYQPANMWSELRASIPGGVGPDLISWSSDAIRQAATEGLILDLDQLGVTPTWLNSTNEPEAASAVTDRAKIWALPKAMEGIVLIYNKDLVGTEFLPVSPLDFADLRSKAQAFYDAKAKPLICNPGFSGGDAYHVAPVFFGFGVPSYVDEFGNAYANTPEAINAGAWLSSMAPISLAAQDENICSAAFAAGNVGIY